MCVCVCACVRPNKLRETCYDANSAFWYVFVETTILKSAVNDELIQVRQSQIQVSLRTFHGEIIWKIF